MAQTNMYARDMADYLLSQIKHASEISNLKGVLGERYSAQIEIEPGNRPEEWYKYKEGVLSGLRQQVDTENDTIKFMIRQEYKVYMGLNDSIVVSLNIIKVST